MAKLKDALNQAKSKKMNFSLVSLSPTENYLIVVPGKVGTAEINAATAELGGGKVVAKGTVEGDKEGVLMFEPAGSAPGTLEATLRQTIKTQAKQGYDLKVVPGKDEKTKAPEGEKEGEGEPGKRPRRPGISDEAVEQVGAMMEEAEKEAEETDAKRAAVNAAVENANTVFAEARGRQLYYAEGLEMAQKAAADAVTAKKTLQAGKVDEAAALAAKVEQQLTVIRGRAGLAQEAKERIERDKPEAERVARAAAEKVVPHAKAAAELKAIDGPLAARAAKALSDAKVAQAVAANAKPETVERALATARAALAEVEALPEAIKACVTRCVDEVTRGAEAVRARASTGSKGTAGTLDGLLKAVTEAAAGSDYAGLAKSHEELAALIDNIPRQFDEMKGKVTNAAGKLLEGITGSALVERLHPGDRPDLEDAMRICRERLTAIVDFATLKLASDAATTVKGLLEKKEEKAREHDLRKIKHGDVLSRSGGFANALTGLAFPIPNVAPNLSVVRPKVTRLAALLDQTSNDGPTEQELQEIETLFGESGPWIDAAQEAVELLTLSNATWDEIIPDMAKHKRAGNATYQDTFESLTANLQRPEPITVSFVRTAVTTLLRMPDPELEAEAVGKYKLGKVNYHCKASDGDAGGPKFCHNCKARKGANAKTVWDWEVIDVSTRQSVGTITTTVDCGSTTGNKDETNQKKAHLNAAKAQLANFSV